MGSPVDVQATILEILRAGETFGTNLIAEVERRTARKLRLSQGSVYTVLRQLEREGLVVSRTQVDKVNGGRPRIYYALTSTGERAAWERRTLVANLFRFPIGESPIS
jgi:PadR family transcriptional regulator, regulatory protein PadR